MYQTIYQVVKHHLHNCIQNIYDADNDYIHQYQNKLFYQLEIYQNQNVHEQQGLIQQMPINRKHVLDGLVK